MTIQGHRVGSWNVQKKFLQKKVAAQVHGLKAKQSKIAMLWRYILGPKMFDHFWRSGKQKLITDLNLPWLRSREQTSVLDFEAASCNGENCHKSIAPTLAKMKKKYKNTKINSKKKYLNFPLNNVLPPCLMSSSVTSKWPYEHALCNGTSPPLSLACTSAPCWSNNWTA